MSTCLPVRETILSARRFCLRGVWKWLGWTGGVGLGMLLVASLLGGAGPAAAPLTRLSPAPSSQAAMLATRGLSAERRAGFLTVMGEVSSLSPRALENVEAVVEFFDAGGRLRSVESALLELPTLRPGEESPFVVQARDVPGIVSYRLRFRRLLGGSLPSREGRALTPPVRPGG